MARGAVIVRGVSVWNGIQRPTARWCMEDCQQHQGINRNDIRCHLLRFQHCLDVAGQPVHAGDNRPRPTDEMGWRAGPLRVRPIERINIPHDLTGCAGQVIAVPGAETLIRVPELHDPWVIFEQPFRPPGSIVAVQHVEPDCVQPNWCGWIFLKNLFLHPPGASDANRSRRRQQKHQARHAGIMVEEYLELVDAL